MTPAAVQAAYARAMGITGPAELATLVRAGDGALYQAHVRITQDGPTDLAGGMQQLRRFAVVLASDVASCGFPVPFKVKSDRIIWDLGGIPRTSAVTKAGERRFQGVIVAYELDLDGA